MVEIYVAQYWGLIFFIIALGFVIFSLLVISNLILVLPLQAIHEKENVILNAGKSGWYGKQVHWVLLIKKWKKMKLSFTKWRDDNLIIELYDFKQYNKPSCYR